MQLIALAFYTFGGGADDAVALVKPQDSKRMTHGRIGESS